jgi:hypothetical protein
MCRGFISAYRNYVININLKFSRIFAIHVHDVQVTSNLREQSYRLDAVRLTGLPPADDESDPKALSKHVYTKALLPILTLAKSKGQLDVVPTCQGRAALFLRSAASCRYQV